MQLRILRLNDVLAMRGISRSAHYRDITNGLFTPAISIGERMCGWPLYEIEALNAARIAGKSDADIRQLVSSLKQKRETMAPLPFETAGGLALES